MKIDTQKIIKAFTASSGRRFGIASLIMAFISVAVAPLIFGVLGIILGMVAVVEGERYLGILGVTDSAVLAFIGYYIALLLLN